MGNIIIPEFKELQFEERSHRYVLDGFEIPSMTTIMKPLSDKVYGTTDPQTLSNAARRGTIVHNAIENYLNFDIEDIPDELKGYFRAFQDWYESEEPDVISTESRVYHKVLRYAGTCDLICLLKGRLTLVDYKTSYALQPMLYPIQLEGYAKAWETHGIKIEDKIILHLKKDGKYSVAKYAPSPEYFSVVNSLAVLYNYQNKF